MKKSVALFLFSLLVLNIFIISIHAEEPPTPELGGNINPETGLPTGVEKVQEVTESLSDDETRSQYLKQEWGKILAKNKYIGPIIAGYEKASPIVDPISKYTIGLEPSLTWIYILTLILWIAFVIYIFRIMEFVSLFSNVTKYLVSIGMVILISVIGVTRKLAEYIINAISLFSTWWMQLILITGVIIAIILASIFSKNLKDTAKAMKEKKDKERGEFERGKIEGRLKAMEGYMEGATGKKTRIH